MVGQAPGWQEDRDGIPWIGEAGQFLSAHLERHGIHSKRMYLTNIVKHYPGKRAGGDAEPPPWAIAECSKHLKAEYALVKPKVIVAVGAISMRFFGVKGGIRQNSGRVFHTSEWGPVIPILHPAGLMRRMADTPQFATQLAMVNTFLRGVMIPPPHMDDAVFFTNNPRRKNAGRN